MIMVKKKDGKIPPCLMMNTLYQKHWQHDFNSTLLHRFPERETDLSCTVERLRFISTINLYAFQDEQ
jgi:hypothetical protein